MSSESRKQTPASHTRTTLRHPRSLLLTSTALAGGIVAGATMSPGTAEASCDVVGAVVTCGTTTTTNTTFLGSSPANDRNYIFSVPTSATVTPGATVDGFGLRFQTTAGPLTMTNNGTIAITDPGAGSPPLPASLPVLELVGGGGTVTYTGNGIITNSPSSSSSDGLFLRNAAGGNIVVTNSAPITGFNAINARVVGTGELHITNSSTITGALNDGIFAIGAQGASNTIDNTGTVLALTNSYGIHVDNFTGPTAGTLTINNSGTVQAGFRGISAFWVPFGVGVTDGGVTVNSTGNVIAGDIGIEVVNATGPISITANNVTSGYHGIYAFSQLSGNVSIQTTGTINANSTSGEGILIDGGGQFLTVNVQSGSVSAANGGGIVVFASTGPHPDSNIGIGVNAGTTVATGNPANFWGIQAEHFSGSGNNDLVVNGSVVGGISSTVLGAGTNLISVGGTVTNSAREGILASAVDGATSITNAGSVTGATAGISAQSTGTGSIVVTNTGLARGTTGYGIGTDTVGGGSNITNGGTVSGAIAGISAASSGAGPISITNTGNVTGGVNAISAQTAGGAINVLNSGLLTSPGGGDGDAVIHAVSTNGSIAITNTASGAIRSLTSAPGGLAIETFGVAAAIANAGTLTGRLLLGGTGNVVGNSGTWLTSGINTINGSIANSGILSTSGTTGFAGLTSLTNTGSFNASGTTAFGGGSFAAINSGTFTTSGATSFTGLTSLTNTGIFNASGTTAFGGGSFINNGAVNLAAGSVGLTSLSSFQNNGLMLTSQTGTSNTTVQASTFTNAGGISLQNNRVGDAFTINGNYVGVPGSVIALDFATQSGTADRVTINGNATGTTGLVLNNVTPLAPFTTTTTLIQVNGTTTPGLFSLVGLQNVNPLISFLLVPASTGSGQSFSLGAAPTAAGLSGAIASLAAFNIAFTAQGVVFDQLQDIRNDIQRRQLAAQTPGSQVMNYQPAAMKTAFVADRPLPAAGPTFRPAAWVRGYGDAERRDAQATFAFGGVNFAPDLGFRQQTAGAMGGADVVIGNLTSAQDGLILGAFGGSIDSVVNLNSAATRLKFAGGTVGGYGTYFNGGFFTDLILKADILSLNATDVGFAQSADLVNYGLASKVGYKVDLPNKYYAEPTASLEYVRTVFDTNTALTSTTLALNNGSAVRAKLGARVGTEWISDQLRVEPSLVASAYSDVAVSNGALFVGGGGIALPTDVGKVRGEVQGSVNFFDLRTGWSGFVRAETRFGDNLLAYGGKGGLRYQW